MYLYDAWKYEICLVPNKQTNTKTLSDVKTKPGLTVLLLQWWELEIINSSLAFMKITFY